MRTPALVEDEGGGLRIALCQVATAPLDLEGNLRRTLQALQLAAAAGADVAITPECVLSGYADMHDADSKTRTRRACLSVDSIPVQTVADRARTLGLTVILGVAEHDAQTGFYHNTALAIDQAGCIAARYRKVHCRPFESAEHTGLFTPGEAFVAFDWSDDSIGTVRIGLMICFDREIPESVRTLRALGAELIACPLATNTSLLDSVDSGQIHNELVTRCRAAENEVFIAVCNHAKRYNGGSFIVGPAGEAMTQMGVAEETRVVEVPIGSVRSRFHCDPLGWMGWGHRRTAAYGPLAEE